MIKKVVILFMKFFVKLYFKLDKVCYCFYIETKVPYSELIVGKEED